MKLGLTTIATLLVFAVAPAPAQEMKVDPAKVDAALKAAFPDMTAEFAARLPQDETMRECSAHDNAPPEAMFEAIKKREKAKIEYPADGKFMGDWKKGEKLAQSGYGLRFNDYPPKRANGGNCYGCHQLTKKELSYGTVGQAQELQRGGCQGHLREDLRFARVLPVLQHAALWRQQGPDHRADQGCCRPADEPGQPGQQVTITSA